MKKLIAILSIFLMSVIVMTGCSKKVDNGDNTMVETTEMSTEASTSDEVGEVLETTEAVTEEKAPIDPRVAQPNAYQINEIEYVHGSRFNEGVLISPMFRKDLGAESFVSIIPIVKDGETALPAVESSIYLASSENGEYLYETMLEDDVYVKHAPDNNYPFFTLVIAPSFETVKVLEMTDSIKPYLPRFDKLSNEDIVAIVSLDGGDRPNIVVYESFNETIIWRYFFYDSNQKVWRIFKEVKLQ